MEYLIVGLTWCVLMLGAWSLSLHNRIERLEKRLNVVP